MQCFQYEQEKYLLNYLSNICRNLSLCSSFSLQNLKYQLCNIIATVPGSVAIIQHIFKALFNQK